MNQDHPGWSCCFVMNNLYIQYIPVILELIAGSRNFYIIREPDWSCVSDIKCLLNKTYLYHLCFYLKVQDMTDLEKVLEILLKMVWDCSLKTEHFRNVSFSDLFIWDNIFCGFSYSWFSALCNLWSFEVQHQNLTFVIISKDFVMCHFCCFLICWFL